YCLDAGRNLSEGTPDEVQHDRAVLDAYLGTTESKPSKRRRAASRDRDLLLEVERLDVSFGKVQVINGVDFEVARGERVALLGTNGAGKSTILKAISGLVPVAAGTVRWKGEDITGMPAELLVRKGLGQVPG